MRFRLQLALVGLFLACDDGARVERVHTKVGPAPVTPSEVRLVEVTAESFESDRLRTRARAAELRIDRRTGIVNARLVEFERFSPTDPEPTGSLVAERATGHISRRDVSLEGNVVVRDREARSATTDRARYVEKDQLLDMPGPVRVQGANFEASGASARYGLKTQKLEVAPPVRASVRPE